MEDPNNFFKKELSFAYRSALISVFNIRFYAHRKVNNRCRLETIGE